MIFPPSPFERFGSRIIGLPEIMDSDDLIPLEETPVLNDEGWDNLTITYATKRASLTAEELAALFPLGTQLGSRKWWVTGSKPMCVALGLWKAEVSFKGWASEKPAKISVGAAASQFERENVLFPGPVTYSRVSFQGNTPTMRVVYLLENYAGAPTSSVGQSVTPPDPIAVPEAVWAALSNQTYNFPNGWVLMGSEPDRLPGSTACLVSDSYKYIYEFQP